MTRKIRWFSQWNALPSGSGWSFTLFTCWYCRYAGGGSSIGLSICNFAVEITWGNPAYYEGMAQKQI